MNTTSISNPPSSEEHQATPTVRGFSVLGVVRWILGSIPTLLVFLGLGGIAYWGHTHGWTVPSFSGSPDDALGDRDDWCSEHHVPESLCVECKPDLLPPIADFGWCREHGVHNCTFEHPELAQLPSVPNLGGEGDKAKIALASRPRPQNNNRCLLYRRRIQFASEEAIAKAGVDIGLVEKRPIVETIKVNAEIQYDQRRVARLSPRASGTVWKVEKEVGQAVRKGDLLALVDSTEVGKAKAELLQALGRVELEERTVKRLRPLLDTAVPEATYLEAEAELREAQVRLVGAQQSLANLGLPVQITGWRGLSPDSLRKRMRFLGLSSSLAGLLERSDATANLVPLYAPLDGVVVDRRVVAGEVVDPSKLMFVVADTRNMWLILDVPQEEVSYVQLGQKVIFETSLGADKATGRITWISTETDENTRTVQVRAELGNSEGSLRAMTFGTSQIVLREEEEAITVPDGAIQWDGSCHVIFVRDKHYFEKDTAKLFHVRTVRPGVKADGYTEVIAGVLPGEVVAVKGSGVLRSQLLRNNLGAG